MTIVPHFSWTLSAFVRRALALLSVLAVLSQGRAGADEPALPTSFVEPAILAERVAKRARETGRAVALDPMNGKDRRLIHIALRDEADIATMSIGEGRYRQVVVVPQGAPEYEQARREAAAAADRSDG